MSPGTDSVPPPTVAGGGFLTIVLFEALLGGLAIAAMAGARRTAHGARRTAHTVCLSW